jgi:four helix bundle protein
MARSYCELACLAESQDLAVRIYRNTESFSRSEIYGLTSQLRRAGISVASNIAEGQGRLRVGEFQILRRFADESYQV